MCRLHFGMIYKNLPTQWLRQPVILFSTLDFSISHLEGLLFLSEECCSTGYKIMSMNKGSSKLKSI